MIVMDKKRSGKPTGNFPYFDFDIPVKADMQMDSFGRFELRIPGHVKNIHELTCFERNYLLKCLVVSLTMSLCMDENLSDIAMKYAENKAKNRR